MARRENTPKGNKKLTFGGYVCAYRKRSSPVSTESRLLAAEQSSGICNDRGHKDLYLWHGGKILQKATKN